MVDNAKAFVRFFISVARYVLLPALNCWSFPWFVFFQVSSHRSGVTTQKYTTIQCTTVARKPQVSFSIAAPTPPKFTVSLCITSRGAWGIRYPNTLGIENTKVRYNWFGKNRVQTKRDTQAVQTSSKGGSGREEHTT